MNDTDHQALAAPPINKAVLEMLQTALGMIQTTQRMQARQIVQAAQIDQLAKTLPGIVATLTEMTGLLVELGRATHGTKSGVIPQLQRDPAVPSAKTAPLSLVPKPG